MKDNDAIEILLQRLYSLEINFKDIRTKIRLLEGEIHKIQGRLDERKTL